MDVSVGVDATECVVVLVAGIGECVVAFKAPPRRRPRRTPPPRLNIESEEYGERCADLAGRVGEVLKVGGVLWRNRDPRLDMRPPLPLLRGRRFCGECVVNLRGCCGEYA